MTVSFEVPSPHEESVPTCCLSFRIARMPNDTIWLPRSIHHSLPPVPSMNPRTKRLLIIALAFDALVVAGVVLYFMLRR